MATASGLNGDVTFANGYTTQVNAWNMNYFASPQDNTSFQPAGDHQTLCGPDMVQGAEGVYTAKLCTLAEADITGVGGEAYARKWTMRAQCRPLMETAFQDDWHSWKAGLITTKFRAQSWVDDTNVLPTGGSGTAVLIVNTGTPNDEYSIPYVLTSANTGISANGTRRESIIEGQASAEPTVNGTLPYVGDTGSATFAASGTTDYTCDILTTGITVSVDRPAMQGNVQIEFVVNSALTSA